MSNFNNKELLTKLKNILNVYNTAFGAAVVPPGGVWVINPGFQNNTGNVLPIGSGVIRYPFKNNNNDGSTRFWLPFLPTGVTEGTMGPATDNIPHCTGTPPNRELGSPCCAEFKDNDTDNACIRFVVEIDHPKLPGIKFGVPPILSNPRGILGPIWNSCTSIVVNGQAVIQCLPLDPVSVVRIPPRTRPVHRDVTPAPVKPPSSTRTGEGRPGGGFRGGGGGN